MKLAKILALMLASATAAPSFAKPVGSSRGRAPRADFRHHGYQYCVATSEHRFDAINIAAQFIMAAKLESYAFIQLAPVHRALLRLFLMRYCAEATREPYIVPASAPRPLSLKAHAERQTTAGRDLISVAELRDVISVAELRDKLIDIPLDLRQLQIMR